MSELKELKLTVKTGENFTPSSLMVRYAALHAGVEFKRLPDFESALRICGDLYKYDHWNVVPGEDGLETVTLFMRKLEKELYRWNVECSWPGVVSENVSVLAESLPAAMQLAREAFGKICGAPDDEIEILSDSIVQEKADLGLELYRAVKDYNCGYADVARFIRLGADVNYRYLPEEFGFTPLHVAAYGADLLKMELLVEAGCDVNALDVDGATPLDRAIARHNRIEVVDYLVEHGALRGLDVALEKARERSKTFVGKEGQREREMV